MVRARLALLFFLTGCSVAPSNVPPPLGPGQLLSAESAAGSVSVGRSSKADVRAALGEATVVDFDSGYEVWVYRERLKDKAPPPAREVVLLFAPSGVLAKMRVRSPSGDPARAPSP